MAAFVYLLCTLTSLVCTLLLSRSYLENRVRLLFWSSICFVGLMVSNCILFIDLIIYPDANLTLYRLLPALIGLLILIYGLIWDTV
jgi:hypothetical protein